MEPKPVPRHLQAVTSVGIQSAGTALAFACLLGWHLWMVLTLFALDKTPGALLDERPVVSGRHALHLYHGYLGASSLYARGTLNCYDPAFQAGYPKTPVFDGGCRTAELFIVLAGGTFRPAAYKIGLAVFCFLVPVFLWGGARASGLTTARAALAVALGLLVWWSGPCHDALEAGEVDLLVASMALLVHVGFLIALHRYPGPTTWFGLVITGTVGLFAEPMLFALLVPILLVYYFSVGPRHRLGWHVCLLVGLTCPVLVNAAWLVDWARSWWLRVPLASDLPGLAHRTLHTYWQATLWGSPGDRALFAALLVLAAFGVLALNETKHRTAARLLGLGGGGFVSLALAGIGWEPLGRLGAPRLLLPALWFAAMPAAAAVALGHQLLLHSCTARRWLTGVYLAVTLPLLVAASVGYAPHLRGWTRATPLTIGLDAAQLELTEILAERTTPSARILLEEKPGPPSASHWTALLPVLTGRAYVGGLGTDAGIEHVRTSLVGNCLSGRPLDDWTEAELDEYCRRYNVGWVVCWSQTVRARFAGRAVSEVPVPGRDNLAGALLTLRQGSYVLRGHARWLGADAERIALADVVPQDGTVVLSLHYQNGLRASPARVVIEREPDASDPIPLVRLRLPGRIAHLTLTSE
jgi:hypothetical protein